VTLAVGTRLAPYEVIGALGAGGMGEVYRARDTRLDRIVALKILPPEFSEDPARRARFTREAKSISQLSHPHICALYDVGRLRAEGASAGQGDEIDFLVMELLEGQTLAQRLATGRLPLDEVVRLGAEIADALAAAHRHGIIHRDLKPSNVMLARGGSASGPTIVKLLDFGLAKAANSIAMAEEESADDTNSLTGEDRVVGTRPYMAPEQLEGRPADARTDIWGLGCVLYEMVAGRRPFDGDSLASLTGAIMNADPPALATVEPLTPPGLEHGSSERTRAAAIRATEGRSRQAARRGSRWIYISGELGIRHEDTVAVTENGCENLAPKWSGTPEEPAVVQRPSALDN